MKEIEMIVRALLAPDSGGAVLATLVNVAGSSYRRAGARLLLTDSGFRTGSISGGCLEEDVLARMNRVAATGCAEVAVYDTTSENDLVWGVGLGCHGVVHVLIERLPAQPAWAKILGANFSAHRPTQISVLHAGPHPERFGTRLSSDAAATNTADETSFTETISPPTSLRIFGAGDDAQPLARLAHELGWRVTVADPRAAFATQERFPFAERLFVGAAAELVAKVDPAPDMLAVVMTHHYVHDVPILRALLSRPLAYLGLLGPKKRAERILADLEKSGMSLDAEQRARLHAPVGLDLGADSPEQVALSILAEMQATLQGRNARPLRERSRPIHS
jgi:xanthine dehydrogenase accessory factor